VRHLGSTTPRCARETSGSEALLTRPLSTALTMRDFISYKMQSQRGDGRNLARSSNFDGKLSMQHGLT
jgi:hypothetical protein